MVYNQDYQQRRYACYGCQILFKHYRLCISKAEVMQHEDAKKQVLLPVESFENNAIILRNNSKT